MRIRLILFPVVVAALGVFCAVVKKEQDRNGRLQIEAARLERIQANRLRLRGENDRLRQALPSTTDMAALRPRYRDIARMRNQIDALNLRIYTLKRSLGLPADPVWPEGAQVVPAGDWKFAGQGSPADTLESVFWTARTGDVEGLAGLILMDPATKAKADAMFAQLPGETRAEYGTSEKVLATLIAAQMPTDYAAVATFREVDSDPDSALLGVRIEDGSGNLRDRTFKFQRDADNWRLDVPAPVASKLAQQLIPPPAPK